MSKRVCFAEPTKYIDVIPESIVLDSSEGKPLALPSQE